MVACAKHNGREVGVRNSRRLHGDCLLDCVLCLGELIVLDVGVSEVDPWAKLLGLFVQVSCQRVNLVDQQSFRWSVAAQSTVAGTSSVAAAICFSHRSVALPIMLPTVARLSAAKKQGPNRGKYERCSAMRSGKGTSVESGAMVNANHPKPSNKASDTSGAKRFRTAITLANGIENSSEIEVQNLQCNGLPTVATSGSMFNPDGQKTIAGMPARQMAV